MVSMTPCSCRNSASPGASRSSHTSASGMVVETVHPRLGLLQTVAQPLRFRELK